MCVLACRLELKWSQDKSIRKVFTCFVCVFTVLMMWSDWGTCQGNTLALERVQILILAEGLNIEFFWHYQVQKAVWYKLFVNLVYTLTLPIHPSTLLGDL